MTCKTCEHWTNNPCTEDKTTGQDAGNCHRYPPRTMPMPAPPQRVAQGTRAMPPFVMVSLFPTTSADDFCGEDTTQEDVVQ